MDKNRAIEPVSLTIPNVVPKEEKKRSKKHKKDNTESNAAPPTPPTPTTPQPTIKHEEKAQIDKVQKGSKIDNQMKCAPKPIPIDFKIKSGENNRISFTVQSSSANDIRIAPQPIKMEKLSLQNTTSSSNINPIVVAPLERSGWILSKTRVMPTADLNAHCSDPAFYHGTILLKYPTRHHSNRKSEHM